MQVKLRSTAWHAKLHRWTFGSVSLRSNLCPYFWLTVFCVIAFPVTTLFRGVRFCFRTILDAIDAMIESSQKSTFASAVEALTMEEAYRLDKLLGDWWLLASSEVRKVHEFDDSDNRYRASDLLSAWKHKHPDWAELFKGAGVHEAWLKYEQQLNQLMAKRLKRKRDRNALMNRIANATRWVFKILSWVVIALLGLFFAWCIYQVIIGFMSIPWLTIIGFALAIAGGAALLIVSVLLIRGYLARRPKKQKAPTEPGLIKLYFQAAKENYCPKIEWDQ